jgi:superfamily II DNA or RNA helicase
MFATVRNRRGVIAGVDPFDGQSGRLHLVQIQYKDDQLPHEERLLWELEAHSRLLEPTALPDPAAPAMPPEDFDALVRAARWTAMSPYLDPDGDGPVQRLPISSPFHGAVQVEDYQVVPLLKALRMPRVNLLIADDVGLGKTVEAGLILTELLLRRRIQRVLILTPASLRLQWRESMWEKFSLPFDFVDRGETQTLRKKLGMDANPWRASSRIISSYHYLRQDDVLEQFRAASQTPDGSPHLPWDLLIVDECHNLMPSPFGDDSDLCEMLRLITPMFEHRVFLSATPHNGHTRSFSGLLEILDPVRFSQVSELNPAQRERVQQVVVRRLKREINARTSPPRFSTRNPPKALALQLSPQEVSLSDAFSAFRTRVRSVIAVGSRRQRRSGSFAVEVLGKRLLSCPTAFAKSWKRSKQGLEEAEAASDSDVAAAERASRQDTGDDREAQMRDESAATVVGAWLKNLAADITPEIEAIDSALAALGLDAGEADVVAQDPKDDARLDLLFEMIDDLVRDGSNWRPDERLIVFTEYKTTLDYLVRRLRTRYESDRILSLFGSGMDEGDRDLVKQAFNDPSHEVRVLVATDAASEGLDLHGTARYLLHYDCPWNPSKLEQRNGRLDRYGQARDVTVHHFVSDQDQDLRFLDHVIRKADEIREDLGSVNELFDEASHRRLIDGEALETVQRDLDQRVASVRGRAAVDADHTVSTATGDTEAYDLAAVAEAVDLDPASKRDTLEAALAIGIGRPQLECAADATCRLLNPGLPGWSEVIDESLRLGGRSGVRGPVVKLTFSTEPFVRQLGERTVFSPRPDLSLIHLSHPMLQQALGALTRRRFPTGSGAVSRWTVRETELPEGTDALLLFSLEELAVNELRETFHHWVRTVVFPVCGGELGKPLPYRSPWAMRAATNHLPASAHAHARAIVEDVEPDLRRHLAAHAERLSEELLTQLAREGEEALRREDERYRSRQGEVSTLIAENTLGKLEREIEKLKAQRAQGQLFDELERLDRIDQSIEERRTELERRTRHYEEVRLQLEQERKRVLNHLLPKRHAMAGRAQIFPVALEVRLPQSADG